MARQVIAYIEGVVQAEVEVPVEVPTDEVVDLCLGRLVEILELVHCLELDDIEAVRQYAVRLALE